MNTNQPNIFMAPLASTSKEKFFFEKILCFDCAGTVITDAK